MRSRRLLVLIVLVAIAVLWFVFLRDMVLPRGSQSSDAPRADEAPPAAATAEGDRDRGPTAAAERPTLAVGSDPAGLGALRVRLLTWRDRKPVAGSPVRLVPAAGAPLERATGADGRVLFSEVPSGEWTLKVDVAPYPPVELRAIVVRARRTTDLDDLLLGEKVVLRGRVVDGKGLPVPGAAVSAFTGGGFDFSQGLLLAMVEDALALPTPVDEAQTDEKGLFALASLTPGTYRLATKRSGYAMDVKADLVVSPDRASGLLTIVLGPPAVVRGKVVDEKDAPIAGATVLAVEDLGMRGMGQSTLRKDYAVTGADGRYALDTLVRGASYRLGVTAKGRAPTFDTQGLTAEAEMERNFTLALGGVIAGTVTDSATAKPIEGARVVAIVGQVGGGFGGRGGRGGRGAPVSPQAPEASASTQVGTTGPDGTFRLEGLKSGPIAFLQVKAAGYSEPPAANPFFGTQPAYGEVLAGETTQVDVKLDAGGVVTGRVLAAGEGGPVGVPGAQVAVVSITNNFPDVFGGYPTGVTDAEGTFRVDGVRAGATFGIVASAPGFVATSAMDAANQGAMPAEAGTVTKDVTLSAAGVVEGVVATSKGVPVAGARVRTRPQPRGGGFGGASLWRMLFPGGGAGVAVSDVEGRYRIENVTAADRMVLEAESDEFVPSTSEPFEVTAGETKRVDLVLQGGATIRGRVIDEQGKTVAGARVRVGRLDESAEAARDLSGWRADALLEPRILFSDEKGAFEVPQVRPGRTLLKVEREGYVTFYRRDLVLAPDQVADSYVVSLSKGEAISGVVRGDDGKPLARVDVAATKQPNPSPGFGRGAAPAPASADQPPEPTVEPLLVGRTDDQGRFVIEGVPPGTSYSVVVWMARGYRAWMQGDEGAIRRGVAPGARDVELKLAKQEPNEAGAFPVPMPRPSPTAPPPPPAPPGMR